MVANPFEQKTTFDKCIVHEVTKAYIVLEKKVLKDPSENAFMTVHKNDFRVGKKIGHDDVHDLMTVNKYFASFDGKKGVEDFVYHVGFKDFDKLADAREHQDLIVTARSNLFDLLNSQTFTKIRPIRHTSEGLEVDDLSDDEKSFIQHYFNQYGMGEDDVFEGVAENKDKVQLLKEYKLAYKELYNSLPL